MSLDVCIEKVLDVFARMSEPEELKDRLAKDYIGRLALSNRDPGVKSEYFRYYETQKRYYELRTRDL